MESILNRLSKGLSKMAVTTVMKERNISLNGYVHKAVIISLYAPGIGIARSLGRAGIRVIALESNMNIPGVHCRYCTVEYCADIEDKKILVATLIRLAEKEKYKPVLYLTNDVQLKIVSEARDILSEFYFFVLPDSKTIDILLEKSLFNEFAEKECLPIPQTIILRDNEKLNSGSIAFPCVIKPNYRPAEWFNYFLVLKHTKLRQPNSVMR